MSDKIKTPQRKPFSSNFSSGPCSKYPDWKISDLNLDTLGRSHRSKLGRNRLQTLIEETTKILNIPKDYKVAIVPASDTGAVEMILWNCLGALGIDVYAWESFGKGWVSDITEHLQCEDTQIFTANYGQLPSLKHNSERDTVFTYNGTTSGVKVPNLDWIHSNRTGLTICDATSAVFAYTLDWSKLDVTTWSWQKCLGGEGAHGMLVLSPRACERLENYKPNRPIPKIFRLSKQNHLIESIFKGDTINTPSMLCVEDTLASYRWVVKIGGLETLIQRSKKNLSIITQWLDSRSWISFLAKKENWRSSTSICFTLNEAGLGPYISKKLEQEGIAYDIASYRDAPEGLRIWGGPTVESSDIEKLLPWLDWAYESWVSEKLI